MGFMDKFGTGEGWLAKNLGKQARIDRKANRRANATPGSGQYNRLSNQINRLSGTGGRIGDDNYRNPFGNQSEFATSKFRTNEEKVGDYGDFDFSKFDVTNAGDVAMIQQRMIDEGYLQPTYVDSKGNTVNSADGIFGNDTEAAYRNYVNAQRSNQGLMGYEYADPNSVANSGVTNAANIAVNNASPTNNNQVISNTNNLPVNSGQVVGTPNFNDLSFPEQVYQSIPSAGEIGDYWQGKAEDLGNYWQNVWNNGFDGKPGW